MLFLAVRYAAIKFSVRLCLLYPSYSHNRASALPSPSLFHYVMDKIMPTMPFFLKSSELFSRSFGRHMSKFFGLMGY